MNSTDKLLSDARRTKKHYRSEHTSYNAAEVCSQIASLFERSNRGMEGLARSAAQYWTDMCLASSDSAEDQPSEKNLEKLGAMQALFDSTDGDSEGTESLDSEDWKTLSELVNFEAEDIPLDRLNDIMMVIVDHVSF